LSLDTRGKGQGLQVLGNYTGAIAYYDKALVLDPKDKYALNDKGVALQYLGNYYGAISYLHKALAVDPKYADAYANASMDIQMHITGQRKQNEQ
jgi:tetratricopeptide (TPR) repeat protein